MIMVLKELQNLIHPAGDEIIFQLEVHAASLWITK